MNRYPFKSGVLTVLRLLAGVTILMAAACSKGSTPGPDGSEPEGSGQAEAENALVTFAASEYERELYDPLIEEFNQQNSSITVQFAPIPEPEPGDEMEEYNYSRVLATTGDTSLMYGSWSLGMEGTTYFRDLGPLLDADPTFEPEDFWAGALNACQDADGRILGIPFLINFNGIFYDAAAFEAAGLPEPTPGWTWDDFRKAATALTRKQGQAVRYGYADQGYLYGSLLGPLVDLHISQHDGDIDAEALEAELEWYFDLVDSGAIYSQRTMGQEDWEQWAAMFQGDDRPAMWAGNLMESLPGEGVEISSDSEGMSSISGLAIQQFGFAPFPVSKDRAAANTTPAYGICGAMSAGTTQPRAAWEWLSFLSRKWLIRDQTQAYEFMQLPGRQSVAEEVGFWEKLPAGLEPTLRFAAEHAWFGSLYWQAFAAVDSALGEGLSDQEGFVAAIERAMTELAATPDPTPDTAAIIVATPLPPPPPGANVVEYYYESYGMPGSGSIKDLIEVFNKEHPDIFVKLAQNFSGPPDGQDYFKYMTDKFDCLTWYTPSFQYEDSSGLLSLDALIEAEGPGFLQDFDPDQLERYRNEGELMGIPAYTQPQIVAYNADLLERRGLEPPDMDWTFDDFIELATRVASTSAGDKSYGMLYSDWEYMLLDGRGVEWADMKTDPPAAYFDSAEMIGALEWLVDLAESGVFLVQKEDDWSVVETAFSSNQVAFWMAQAGNKEGWYWSENAPKIGVAPMPAMPEPAGPIYWSSENGHFISRSAEDPQACWTWIKYLSEQPNIFPGVPGRISVAESPEWETFVGPEDAAVYRLASSRVQPQTVEEEYSRTSWPFYSWRSQAVTAALNGEDPKEVLDEAQRKAEAYIDCIGGADPSELSDEEVQEQVTTCARQADPDGQW